MLTIYFNKRVIVIFFIVFVLVSWLAISSFYNSRKLISSSRWVTHTHEVLYNGQRILALALDIELGQRGYALTGNEAFLEPFHNARKSIIVYQQNINKLTRDNISQQKRLKELSSAIDDLLLFSSSAVLARQSSPEKAKALNEQMNGRNAVKRIRAIFEEFEKEEHQLLQARVVDTETQIQKFNSTLIATLVILLTLLFLAFYAINRSITVRAQNEKRLKKASEEIQDLYDNAPCGYHSLNEHGIFIDINNTLLKWLGFAKKSEVVNKLRFEDILSPDDISHFHENFKTFKERGSIHNLEFNFVKADGSLLPVVLSSTAVFDNGRMIRTRSNTFDNSERKLAEQKIHNLNHELEAFTYSVSHDLRAPLRSIDGYARVLEEDYTEKLDDEGRRVIKVIMNNAKRMASLIDDLLEFSRLGRTDISKSAVDMTPVVKNIISEMVNQNPHRVIEFNVGELLPAVVDLDMMRQVWINLISNAIKYSAKKEKSEITIRSYRLNGDCCYEVTDNGVGFNMAYVDKLFGVFQRLHKVQDFEGTGVGLAIVKRIISRHNGKVWAEGKLNTGATFYFTLPS